MPPPSGTPAFLTTVGDHIRAARLKRGLEQKALAAILGTSKETIWNWESNRNSPRIPQCGKVIQFLGYDPFPAPSTFAERLVSFRRARGLRVKNAARMAGVDPCSWTSWENEEHAITPRSKEKILSVIAHAALPDPKGTLKAKA